MLGQAVFSLRVFTGMIKNKVVVLLNCSFTNNFING
jgi:hypothetical protein